VRFVVNGLQMRAREGDSAAQSHTAIRNRVTLGSRLLGHLCQGSGWRISSLPPSCKARKSPNFQISLSLPGYRDDPWPLGRGERDGAMGQGTPESHPHHCHCFWRLVGCVMRVLDQFQRWEPFPTCPHCTHPALLIPSCLWLPSHDCRA
jgi:hypothetical protein